MAYLKIIGKYPPYALMLDKRGFISRLYGGSHSGVDSVGNQWDNPVCAIIDGVVLQAYISASLGKVVVYGAGRVKIAYYHLAKMSVKVGQTVTAGKTQIGVEGNSGSLSDGKHLHISIWIDDQLVNPLPYLCGTKAFPAADTATDDKGGDDLMICKTTVNLNLRKSAPSGDVIITVPSGTLLICGKTKTISGKVWAQAVAEVKGKTYAGWCCTTGYTAEV